MSAATFSGSETGDASERRVVVALGAVDAAEVMPYLPECAHFVSHPTDPDLAVAEAAIVRAAFDLDRATLDRMPRLRVIARTGVGVDRVDVAAAHERGIPVAITPGSNSRAVAEGAFAMLAALVKNVGESHRYVSAGEWGRRPVPQAGDLYGRTLAVLGYGRIGRIVAGYGRAFGMEVVVHDPYVTADDAENVTLEEAVRRADALTLHLPGGGGEMLPLAILRTAKPGLVLVNCARADLVSTVTLQEALDTGILGGVGLDVFETEPVQHHPLAGRTDVLLSPHTSGFSLAARRETVRMAAEAVSETLSGRYPTFTVGDA